MNARAAADKARAALMKKLSAAMNGYAKEHMRFAFARKNPVIRLHEATYGAEEVAAALDCLLSTYVTMGKKVLKFEDDLARYHKTKGATVVNSGSSANLLAMAALANPKFDGGLRPGDEVIVPALCWSTTIWPIVQMGLVPVIVDVDPETLNVDPEQIERAITPKTRGIVPVHVYGNPCDMDALMDIARRHDLIVMEDCCEALGATYKKKSVGTFGAIGTFSFYFSHHITTLEGGVCVTNDERLAELMRVLRAHGWVRDMKNPAPHLKASPEIDPKFLFINVGYNLRPTELQGAMGSIQLKKLNGFVKTRASNAAFWRKEFAGYEDIFRFQKETPGAGHSWFGFPTVIKDGAPFSVGELRRHLSAHDIESRPIIAGNIAVHPAMKDIPHRVVGDLKESAKIMRDGFTFGNHQNVDGAARRYIADAVHSLVAKSRGAQSRKRP